MAQTKPKAAQFYGVSDNGTDGQFLKTDGTGGMSWDSPITNPTITSIDYPGSATAADPAGGESVIINGTLFASGITCTVGGTSAVTAFNSANQITITTPAKAAGQYTVVVTNPDGGTVSQANFIQYSGVPVWSTAAGNIGSVQSGLTASFQVTATEGSDTIEYAVTTGTLPTGLSLATATGAITGTAGSVSASTTTTFSITATDDENQTSSARSFNITVTPDFPSNYFDTILYNGNGGSQSITGLNFSPDFVWIKARQATAGHQIFDTIRGVHKSLGSNGTDPQYNNSPYCLTSFDSNGFAVTDQTNGGYGVNGAPGQTYTGSNADYVAWCFKAGGTAVANTDGTITSQVSVNNTLGFSIVDYETSGVQSIGHGLDSTPELVIQKIYSATNAWIVYASVSGMGTGKYLKLNDGVSVVTDSYFFSAINNSTFTTSWSGTNYKYINYCFTSKQGFSKIGSYIGNTSSPPIVSTGFEPAFLMIKSVTINDSWFIVDNKRETTNPRGDRIFANSGAAEASEPGAQVNFLSNGFQITGSGGGAGQTNNNGTTYLYLAFAADPSTTTPSLANSFNAVKNDSPSTNQAISAGFKPDAVWIKSYSNSGSWGQYDTVRGSGESIQSDNTDAEFNYAGHPNGDLAMKFTASGYTTPPVVNANINNSGYDYINYFWKSGGLASINTGGSVTSLVSANQAAGFSVVKCISPSSNINFNYSHGLSKAPELVIVKTLNIASYWEVIYPDTFGSSTGSSSPSDWNRIKLNESDGVMSSNAYLAADSTKIYNGAWTANTDLINYCFTSITGYSKVGTYSGSNGASTKTITTGFEPGFLMIKRTDAAGGWRIFDGARDPGSAPKEINSSILANSSAAGYTASGSGNGYLFFSSTGFYFPSGGYSNSDINGNGTYIYLAIKEN